MEIESIEQKLEQIEKIIQICLQTLPRLNENTKLNATSNTSSASVPNSASSSLLFTPGLNNAPVLKLFAKQLITLKDCNKTEHSYLFDRHPSLKIWLQLLNLTESSLNAINSSKLTFHDLNEKLDQNELNLLLKENHIDLNETELNSIFKGFQNLKPFYSAPNKPITALSSSSVSQSNSSNSSSSSSVLLNTLSLDAQQQLQMQQQNSRPKVSEPHIHTNSIRVKQQRKSESDVQVNSVTKNDKNKTNLNLITSNLQANFANKNSLSSNNFAINSSPSTSSASSSSSTTNQYKTNGFSFSPNLPVKSNKKMTGQKVTTPPPFRKLSTGNPCNVINLNDPQLKAVALSAAVAAAKTTSNNLSTGVSMSPNIQRSSSHESHLRNKINSNQAQELLSPIASNSSDANEQNCENPTVVLNSCKNQLNESVQRRLSTEGSSEFSSRCTSGQASPCLQSPTRSFASKSSNNNFLNDCDSNRLVPKSPKLSREHRWSNTFKVANCGLCGKKMIFGIKCKNCKFLKYIRIKNIKMCEVCHKPLWHGIKCKNCKFRCHKECEKKCSQTCSANSLVSLVNNVFPTISLNSTPEPQSGSSSAASSAAPSPAFNNLTSSSFNNNNNNNNTSPANNTDQANQSSWTSGVVRYANKIVNSINNSVSTPKLNSKFNNNSSSINTEARTPIQEQSTLQNCKNATSFESRSSSSCNSSEPNSPNNFKQYQLNLNPTEKRPSYSSVSSASFGFFPQQHQQIQQQQSLSSTTSTITPAQTVQSLSNSSSILSPNSTSKSRNPSTSNLFTSNKLDTNNNNLEDSENIEDKPKINKESRDHLTLDFNKEMSPVNTNDDFNNLVDDYINEADKNENEFNVSQASDLQQFNIPYEEITDKVEIGGGRFGVVYRAYWHGLIAIKEIDFNKNLNENSDELKSFKEEVLNLRKTRHSNLILFIGACIKPPKCAIVMSLCRGVSLYKYLHTDSASFPKANLDWTIDICTQIAQAMGYLHNKQMTHKDLRSKNVFIDGCKAVITDFGLYSIRSLCNGLKRDDLLPITKECLYYMAPEIVRLIGTNRLEGGFSQASDVFSFGTLWYEMFCHEYPFSHLSTHAVLYLIGNGLKNLSPNIQIPKEFKIILLKCWSKEPSNRPDFSRLLETFRAIPKKTKLFRSPSHPVHINMR